MAAPDTWTIDQLADWMDRFEEMPLDQERDCAEGHFGCSVEIQGPCMNEVESALAEKIVAALPRGVVAS